MLSMPVPKLENQLQNKRYRFSGLNFLGDTAVKTYTYRPVIKNTENKQIL
jgi:hypothetical protein